MPRSRSIKAPTVSILILTLNEEINISACLDSVGWSDDIVVLDSGSRDKTTALAKKKGARVVTRIFDNWATHQNWALDHIKFKNQWVFYLDADERMTAELKGEILTIAADLQRPENAFFVGRRNYLWGQWLKHAFPPGYILRFFKPSCVRFERLVNPTPVIQGPHGYLKNYFDHYNFSKGLEEWFAKHNRYSTLEALEGMKTLKIRWKKTNLFSLDPYARRQALKSLSVLMPFRPLSKFFYLYIFKRGFLDGRGGLTYCVMQSFYEFMIAAKIRELKLKEKGFQA